MKTINDPNLSNLCNIPAMLKKYTNFVLWKKEKVRDRITKIPYQANDKKASPTNVHTWCTYDEAVRALLGGAFSGIGFVFSDNVNITGIDIDKCIIDGEINSVAKNIVTRLNSYTEKSPSGIGLHIFVEGKINNKDFFKNVFEGTEIEIYDTERFFTLTGDCIVGGDKDVCYREEELNYIYQEIFKEKIKARKEFKQNVPPVGQLTTEDEVIIEKARSAKNGAKFCTLFYEGNTSEYGDNRSDAEIALCNIISYWCLNEKDRYEKINRIMRRSKLLRGEERLLKWERLTNSQANPITNAISYVSGAIQNTPEKQQEKYKDNTKEIKQGKLVIPYGYTINFGKLYIEKPIKNSKKEAVDDLDDKKTESVEVYPGTIEVTAFHRDIITHEERYEVKIKRNGYVNEFVEYPETFLDKSKILTNLARKGLKGIDSENTREIVKYINKYITINENAIPVKKCTKVLGWTSDLDFVDGMNGDIELYGPEKESGVFEKKGSSEVYLKTFSKIWKEEDDFAIVMVGILNSFMLYLTKNRGSLLYLLGDSGSGKTTSTLFAAAMIGNPFLMVEGWKDTQVYLIGKAAHKNHFPIIIDEKQELNKNTDVEKLIYSLVNGIETGRGDQNGDPKKKRTFNLSIVASGEENLNEDSANEGAHNRIIQLNNFRIKSENLFGELINVSKEHYGHGLKIFIDFLKENLKKDKNIFKRYQEEIKEILKSDYHDVRPSHLDIASQFANVCNCINGAFFKDQPEFKRCPFRLAEYLIKKSNTKITIPRHKIIYDRLVSLVNERKRTFTPESFDSPGGFDLEKGIVYFRVNAYRKYLEELNCKPETVNEKWAIEGLLARGGDNRPYNVRRVIPIYQRQNNEWVKDTESISKAKREWLFALQMPDFGEGND